MEADNYPVVEDATLFTVYESANCWYWWLGSEIAHKLILFKVARKLKKYRSFKNKMQSSAPQQYEKIFRNE